MTSYFTGLFARGALPAVGDELDRHVAEQRLGQAKGTQLLELGDFIQNGLDAHGTDAVLDLGEFGADGKQGF